MVSPMRKTLTAVGVLVTTLVAGARAQAPASVSLSFADAVRRAAASAPVVELAGLQTSEADARVRQARSAFLPSLALSAGWVNRDFNSHSLGITFPTIPGQPPFPELIPAFNNYDARITATETLLDFSSSSRLRAARAQADAGGAEQTAVVEGAAQGAALAYLRAARAAASAGARRADSSIAAELVHLAEAQKAAGVSAAIDVTRARTQLVVAEGLLVVASSESERARIDLARALGIDPATPLVLTDTLSSSLGAADVPGTRDSAVTRAVAARPDLMAEVARGVAARRTGSAIAAERLPRLSVEGDYGVNGLTAPASIATRQVAVQMTIPLIDGFRREGRLAEQDAISQESAVREQDLRQQIAADVDAALLDQRSAAAQQRIAAERLLLAEDELSEARERFSAGVAGNIEVIDAQSSLIQARDADIDARFSAAVARVSLARAVGVARTLH